MRIIIIHCINISLSSYPTLSMILIDCIEYNLVCTGTPICFNESASGSTWNFMNALAKFNSCALTYGSRRNKQHFFRGGVIHKKLHEHRPTLKVTVPTKKIFIIRSIMMKICTHMEILKYKIDLLSRTFFAFFLYKTSYS